MQTMKSSGLPFGAGYGRCEIHHCVNLDPMRAVRWRCLKELEMKRRAFLDDRRDKASHRCDDVRVSTSQLHPKK